MRYDLARMAARKTNRRSDIVLPNIATTAAQTSSLAAIYIRVVNAWTEGTGRIVESYERTLAELVTDAPADTTGAIDDVNAQIQRLILILTPDLRDWAVRVEEVHRGQWIRNVFSAASVDLSTMLFVDDVASTLEAVINWNVSLVRDVSDELRRRISNLVFSGFTARKPARVIAKEIREATGLARARSIRIASDQTVKLGAKLNEARQRQAGLDHFKWRHSGKVHPRAHHKARDGKVYSWEDPGIPADDLPGIPPYCGCNAQGVLVLD